MTNNLIISIGTLQSGGAERVVSEISSLYCDHFRKVTILTWIEAPVFYDIDSRVRLICAEKESGSTSRLRQALWVRGFVKKERPDVFLSFLMPFNMMSIAALSFTGIRVVVCERQDPSAVKTPALRTLRNFFYHFCSRIEVQTSAGKQYFSPALQYKTCVIPNPNHITINQRSVAMKTEKANRIVTIGRLIAAKNHTLLINAFAQLHRTHPEYRLEIYGEGDLNPVLQQQINSLGLTQNVFLNGRTNKVPEVLATAKIFVLSSNIEGMPNALMEAMALGIPCVATDVSGVRDIITDGENGFIVPVGNQTVLAERIIQLIESEELQQQFSEASSFVFEKFDKDKIFKKWLDLVSF